MKNRNQIESSIRYFVSNNANSVHREKNLEYYLAVSIGYTLPIPSSEVANPTEYFDTQNQDNVHCVLKVAEGVAPFNYVQVYRLVKKIWLFRYSTVFIPFGDAFDIGLGVFLDKEDPTSGEFTVALKAGQSSFNHAVRELVDTLVNGGSDDCPSN